MNTEKLAQFFYTSNLVSKNDAEEIASRFEWKTLSKNEFFLQGGKISDDYYILQQGMMRSFAYDTAGNDVTTSFYSANDVVFEVFSFFNRTRSKENIQSLTNCAGWQISFEDLNHLFHSMQGFREFGRSILVRGYSTLKERMLAHITETAEERYHSLIKNNPDLFQYAQLKHIASYLGITDTSLSRIRKEFVKKSKAF